jgi:carbamoyltransferase
VNKRSHDSACMILGINEGIDAAVVLCRNGRIIFALQEERLNGQKGYIGFPVQAVAYCSRAFSLHAGNVSHVCFSNLHSPPNETRADLLEYYARSLRPWYEGLAAGDVRGVTRLISSCIPTSAESALTKWRLERRSVGQNKIVEHKLANLGLDSVPIQRYHHHSNHAASAYYGLRKNGEAPHLVFTSDGGGDDACSHVYLAQGESLRLIASTPSGHSLGNLYACTTYLMGMRPHEHEYKLMGLAPYCKVGQADVVKKRFATYLDLDPRNPLCFKRMIPERTSMILPRLATDFSCVRFDALAAGLQDFTEELLLRWISSAIEQTGVKNILVAGGVFMNVKVNKRIAEFPAIEFFEVFPSCGDETLPFGAVWQCHVQNGGISTDIKFDGMCLGPEATLDVAEAKRRYAERVQIEHVEDPEAKIAELLAVGHVVARCTGPMEFGARGLGNRSILADPSHPQVVGTINRLIKRRDFWMPFAPAILEEKADDYVRIPESLRHGKSLCSMMHAFDTTARRQELIAGVHPADGTARAQIVRQHDNPRFHSLITHFGRLTGRWAILNTSFNLHGSPMVMGLCDAIDVLLASDLQYLVADHYLVTKRTMTQRDS